MPTTIPFSIDWLPDGQLLVVAGLEQRLLRLEPDGSLVDHADLSGLPGGLNEIVIDGRGTIYVNGGSTSIPTRASRPASLQRSARMALCVRSPTVSPSLTAWR